MICVTDWRLHSILRERASVPLHPCRVAPQLGETPLAARGTISLSDWTSDSATITSVRPKPPRLDSKAAHDIQRGAISFATSQLASLMISVSQP